MSLQRHSLAVYAFGAAFKIAAWLSTLPNRLTPAPFRLMQIGSAFWQSRALYVAARLDIAGILGDDRLSVAEIAGRTGADPDALHRLLRMLASVGVFREMSAGLYRNNKLSSCLRTGHLQCVRPMILMHNSDATSRPWYEQLEQGIRTGEVPFRLTHGQELYAWMDAHPDFDALFGQAMDSVEALIGDSFTTEFDWRPFTRMIDVGGSRGAKSVAILRRHPHLEALVVDRAQAIRGAAEYWAAREPTRLTARLRFEVGDALRSVPAAASDKDVYLLSALLHGYGDDACINILRNVSQAAAPKGAWVVVMEMVLADCRADLAASSLDMQMFVNSEGRERTLAEWNSLFERSGLRLREIVRLASLGQMLVLQAVPR
ncbi:methyltransferase [Methylococcus sp. EFPC2]|uniref:methyltransferase n=1 Tax=Methylococcus sp. EFPC2 TaxID=2812648 RepID=UPI00196743DB|nr:methyltransferase [Methylococcus sp. EFPC2]QSA97634.1 methyltransferase [Methylococcus sp. EFPC2]